MRVTTLSDHLRRLVAEKQLAPALVDSVRAWEQTNHHFSRWIHESAKKEADEKMLINLAEAEELLEGRVMKALTNYASNESGSEIALIEAIREMNDSRRRLMELSPPINDA